MQLSSLPVPAFKTLLVAVLAIAVVSCSSTQNVYDEDGIYSSNTPSVATDRNQNNTTVNAQEYKNYFEQGAKELEAMPEEGAIFTDVESYTSDGGYGEEGVYDENGYVDGRAGWGEETENVVVNVYNDPFIGFGGGWGWNRWGWNRWGWNNWGWGGFGWNGWGAYGWNGWGPGFGWGWGNAWSPFCYGGNFINNPYAFNNGFGVVGRRVAYNTGRRANAASFGRRGNASRAVAESRTRLRGSRDTYSRVRGTRPSSRGDAAKPTRPSSRPSYSSRPNASRPSASRPSYSSRPNASRPNASRPSASRPSGNSRPNYSRPSNSRPNTSRPASRPSRPSYSRPSSSSRPSYSRPSSSSRGSSGGRSSGGSRGRRG